MVASVPQGRPSRLDDSPCPAAAASDGSGPLAQGPGFSEALRQAVQAKGIGLERLRARLVERGTPVSVATLSYWQSGRSQPERPESLRAVGVLEDVLQVRRGSLTELLGSPRPRGRPSRDGTGDASARQDVARLVPHEAAVRQALEDMNVTFLQKGLTRLSLHDSVEIGADRRECQQIVRQVLRAERDDVPGTVFVFQQDSSQSVHPTITALTNCRIGEVRIRPDLGLLVAEISFVKPLRTGESVMVEFMVESAPTPDEAFRHERRCQVPVREVVFDVRFAPGTLPARVERYTRTDGGERVQPLELVQNKAHVLNVDFGPGLCGVRWSW